MPEEVVQQSQQTEKPASDSGAKGTESVKQQDTKPASDQRPGAAGGSDGTSGKSGDDARQRGILADLQKERSSRRALEKRLQELERTNTERDRRIREAVVGETPEEAEKKQIREALFGMSPRLRRIEELSDEQFEGLLQSIGVAETVEEAELRGWTHHGRQMLEATAEKIAEKLGGELSDRQRKAIVRFYVGEAEADPDFLRRHEGGDPKLIEEVAAAILEDWYEPARRAVTSTEVNRIKRVPGGKDRSVTTQGKKKIDFKDPKAVEDAMVQSFRDHGGQFEG